MLGLGFRAGVWGWGCEVRVLGLARRFKQGREGQLSSGRGYMLACQYQAGRQVYSGVAEDVLFVNTAGGLPVGRDAETGFQWPERAIEAPSPAPAPPRKCPKVGKPV